jgi:hypothetical protein
MYLLRRTTTAVLALILLICWPLLANDQELLNQGKILMFDRKWEEARAIFQRFAVEYPKSNLVPQAYFFAGRCLQLQGKDEDALRAYEAFLQKYPNEPYLPPEAKNAVVELAASLMEKGNAAYKNRLVAGLSDPKKEVRYFTAIRSCRLTDKSITSMAVPVLKEIVRNEKKGDLVDRAQIALLRLDPKALSNSTPAEEQKKKKSPSGQAGTKMFHLVVRQEGSSQPTVELNIPVSLAQLAIAAMDESAKAEMRKKGIDVDNIWEDLKRLGPTNIITFRDGKNIVMIWIE